MRPSLTQARRAAQLARAGAVTFGGQLTVVGALGAATAIGLADLVAHRRANRKTAAILVGGALYVAVAEPWMRTWGSTGAERRADLPGDDLEPDPGLVIDHALTIEAPPDRVWPWLAQIGQDRGGFYSYEWLENLAGCRMRNADRIHPQWQRREIGEEVMLHPLAPGMPVSVFDPPHASALAGWGRIHRATRRATTDPAPGPRPDREGRPILIYRLTLAIPHFVMERKMLLGIKARAESVAAAETPPAAQR